MLSNLRPALARLLIPAGRLLARTPVTPNVITVIGTLGVSAGALALFPTGHLFAGTIICTAFVFADMLDGALARVRGTSGRWGAFLDSTLDRIGDAAVFGGLVLWFMLGGRDKVLAAVALYCLVAGALVSYAKARAEGLGVRCDVGIAERSERLLIALVATGLSGLGVPYVLPAGLWLLAAASTITFGQRVIAVRRGAAGPAAEAPAGAAPAAGEPAAGEQAAGEQAQAESAHGQPGRAEAGRRDERPGAGGAQCPDRQCPH